MIEKEQRLELKQAKKTRNTDEIRFVTRNNTESLNPDGTMQKVIEIQENLNVPIEMNERNSQLEEDKTRNGESVLEQIDTIQDTVYKQMAGTKTRQFGGQAGKPAVNTDIKTGTDDVMTPE